MCQYGFASECAIETRHALANRQLPTAPHHLEASVSSGSGRFVMRTRVGEDIDLTRRFVQGLGQGCHAAHCFGFLPAEQHPNAAEYLKPSRHDTGLAGLRVPNHLQQRSGYSWDAFG